jgi:hypothetical protein
MSSIGPVQAVVTADEDGREPTVAELDAIEWETPLILAEAELLDAEITALDHPANELDRQRIRRAQRRVLAARRELTNQAGLLLSEVVA